MPALITSPNNPRIKEVAKLDKRSVRDRERLTVVEGQRECSLALASGIQPVQAFICPQIGGTSLAPLLEQLRRMERERRLELFEVSPEAFAKIAYRGESGGILLVMPYLDTRLSRLPLRDTPFFVVVEGVEKPGNFGAILRTADAAGVDGVILVAGGTDLHNPNVIRAGLGALFTVPVAEAAPDEAIQWLRRHGIRIVVTSPDATTRYTEVDLSGPVAIVMGSEAEGLGPIWFENADDKVVIPMRGAVDSLNLSVSTALLLYEVVRQRGA
jgi:TrmH family RNA methyltransferase